MIAVGLLSIDWGKTIPIHYSSVEGQKNLMRVADTRAPSGEYVLRHTGKQFHQTITQQGQHQIAGNLVTFSAWIWADQETDIVHPVIGRLDTNAVVFSEDKIHVTTEPTLHSSTVEMPAGDYVAWLTLYGSTGIPIYWDDIFLITEHTSEQSRTNDIQYINVIRNSSIEDGFPKLSDRFDWLLAKTGLNISSSQIIELFDYESSGWYLRTTASMFFKTFWGYFGWGAVPLLGTYAYQGLLFLTILCSLISLFFLVKKFRFIPKSVIFIFAVIVLLQLFIVFSRGTGSWYTTRYYPPARYFYPAIIPIVTYFSYGIYRLMDYLIIGKKTTNEQRKATWRVQGSVLSACMMVMIIWGIISIYSYYF